MIGYSARDSVTYNDKSENYNIHSTTVNRISYQTSRNNIKKTDYSKFILNDFLQTNELEYYFEKLSALPLDAKVTMLEEKVYSLSEKLNKISLLFNDNYNYRQQFYDTLHL